MNRVRVCEIDLTDSGQGPVVGSFEYGNEKLGSIKAS
jgi:hypothetical protein